MQYAQWRCTGLVNILFYLCGGITIENLLPGQDPHVMFPGKMFQSPGNDKQIYIDWTLVVICGINFDLGHDTDFEFSRSNIEFAMFEWDKLSDKVVTIVLQYKFSSSHKKYLISIQSIWLQYKRTNLISSCIHVKCLLNSETCWICLLGALSRRKPGHRWWNNDTNRPTQTLPVSLGTEITSGPCSREISDLTWCPWRAASRWPSRTAVTVLQKLVTA